MPTSTLHSTGHPACLVLLATTLLGGCSHTAVPSKAAWRIEPVLRTEHSPGVQRTTADAAEAAGHVARARQLQGEGRAAEALRAWRLAAALAPQDPQVLHHLGIALAQQGHLGEALLALRRADTLAPDNPTLLNNLGYVLLLDGQHEPARRLFERALRLAPEHPRAQQNLARLSVHPPLQAAPTMPPPTTPVASVAALSPLPPPAHVAPDPDPGPGATMPPPASRTAAAPQPVAVPTDLTGLRTEIINGNGQTGAAARMGHWLKRLGATGTRLGNRKPFDTARTVVQYRPGQLDSARALARQMAVPVKLSEMADLEPRCDLRVVLGQDLRSHGPSAPASASRHARKGLAHMPATLAAGG